ncbi:MAG: hypothetical protein EP329_18515 [Deltaproteobacteria bacterium]|nr:MAG: hypothetical protein EP329_18515 [Deltaproteobacteria bacterium]
MMMTLVSLTAATLLAAPSITEVQPVPLAIGGVAEVSGDGFVADATSITIGAVAQSVVNVQPQKVRFVVAAETPLGSQTLVVTTADGSAQTTVEVAPPAPTISNVAPSVLILGGIATVQGTDLDVVTGVTLGGVAATVREQTTFILSFDVPFDATLLGNVQLALASPRGDATRMVDVQAPTPDIDSIGPNPARQGDLVTIRGTIVPVAVKVRIGLVEAELVEAGEREVTVLVPDEVSVGPHDVTVSVGQQTSAPAGPLYIQAGDPLRPRVDGVYPVNVAQGGTFWIIGAQLGEVTDATHGLEVLTCDKRACRIDASGAPVGTPFKAAVTSPAGSTTFTLQVTEEALLVPKIASVSPDPAFRGESLTLTGTELGATRTVVIGGRTQSITYFDATTVTLTVHPDTPMGAQRLFIAGTGGSDPVDVTILDPFPNADEDDADVIGDTSSDDTAPPKKKDDCAAGGGPTPWAGVLAALALLMRRRRRVTSL